jgi:hydrogenase assembly chaperone HypC/HupF
MCLATPMRVIKIQKEKAIVQGEGHTHEVDISLIKNKKVKVGDFILAHGDLAIHKLPLKEAKKILKFIEASHHDSHH